MRSMLVIAAAAALIAPAAHASTNVIANQIGVSSTGVSGVLRAGSPWGPGSAPSSDAAPVDGVFRPEGTQWNNGSFWWDADRSVNTGPVTWEVQLDRSYRINQLVLQADDNDSYLIEYWNGSGWSNAFSVPAVFSFGLVTRDSGVVPSFQTDRFRISGVAGDNYFAFSEFQAFGAVPEPASWALLIAGFGLVGAAQRRRKAVVAV